MRVHFFSLPRLYFGDFGKRCEFLPQRHRRQMADGVDESPFLFVAETVLWGFRKTSWVFPSASLAPDGVDESPFLFVAETVLWGFRKTLRVFPSESPAPDGRWGWWESISFRCRDCTLWISENLCLFPSAPPAPDARRGWWESIAFRCRYMCRIWA